MKSRSAQTAVSNQQEVASNDTSSQKSLKDLIGLGQTQECTFTTEGSSGKVYIGGGKMRGDFSTTTEGQTVISLMLVDGQTS